MNKTFVIILSALVLMVLGFFGYIEYRFYFDGLNKKTESSETTDRNTSPTPKQTSSPDDTTETPSRTYPVKVYFSKTPDSDNDPSAVFAVSRISPDVDVGMFSVGELLEGPTSTEKEQGYFSFAKLRNETSNCEGKDFTLVITDGIATLQFCKTFDHLGSVSDGQAESQIKATLKQFSTISKVVILNKTGDCEFNLSGMNLCKEQ